MTRETDLTKNVSMRSLCHPVPKSRKALWNVWWAMLARTSLGLGLESIFQGRKPYFFDAVIFPYKPCLVGVQIYNNIMVHSDSVEPIWTSPILFNLYDHLKAFGDRLVPLTMNCEGLAETQKPWRRGWISLDFGTQQPNHQQLTHHGKWSNASTGSWRSEIFPAGWLFLSIALAKFEDRRNGVGLVMAWM